MAFIFNVKYNFDCIKSAPGRTLCLLAVDPRDGVRRVERRRMKDMREEVGTKACIVDKIVKSRMKWAGHIVRMKDDKLPKRADTKNEDGSRK